MNASPPLPAVPSFSNEDVAVRLADEGVPVRAIARAIKIPGEEVYDLLKGAIAAGKIIELPGDDWPPGSLRQRRVSNIPDPFKDESKLRFWCSIVFKATKLEAALLALLLRRSDVTKKQLHTAGESTRTDNVDETSPKIVDVIICKLRKKLQPFNIEIVTVWGVGYRIPHDHCAAALKLISEHTDMQELPVEQQGEPEAA